MRLKEVSDFQNRIRAIGFPKPLLIAYQNDKLFKMFITKSSFLKSFRISILIKNSLSATALNQIRLINLKYNSLKGMLQKIYSVYSFTCLSSKQFLRSFEIWIF